MGEARLEESAAREDESRLLHQFLVWLEDAKGLVLCQEFKPKYDWYTRVPTDKMSLANEFPGKNTVVSRSLYQPTTELTTQHKPKQRE